jgi:hypothetical protein
MRRSGTPITDWPKAQGNQDAKRARKFIGRKLYRDREEMCSPYSCGVVFRLGQSRRHADSVGAPSGIPLDSTDPGNWGYDDTRRIKPRSIG